MPKSQNPQNFNKNDPSEPAFGPLRRGVKYRSRAERGIEIALWSGGRGGGTTDGPARTSLKVIIQIWGSNNGVGSIPRSAIKFWGQF